MAIGREIRALLVLGMLLAILVVAAASVVAYGQTEAIGRVSLGGHQLRISEPAFMLLSGSALLVVAGALRRIHA